MKILRRPWSSGAADLEWKRILRSVGETTRLGRLIGTALRGGEVLALQGLVGTGKTTLVRAIAKGLKADPDRVASPTFVFVHEYRGRLPLVHADLYRIRSEADAFSLGLDEYFDGATVTAIEWADKSFRSLPHDRLEIRLDHRGARTRGIAFRALGPVSGLLLDTIRTGYARGFSKRRPSRIHTGSLISRRRRS